MAVLALLLPVAANAGGRFALENATVSSAASSSGSTVLATSRYRLDGTIVAGSDEIFSDGFESGESYKVDFNANVPIGGSPVLLGNVNVPPGSYVAYVRLQVRSGTESDPGNSYRFDCNLAPGFDSASYRIGLTSNVERYFVFHGAAALNSAGAIQFSCSDPNGHTNTALSGNLMVLSVSAIN